MFVKANAPVVSFNLEVTNMLALLLPILPILITTECTTATAVADDANATDKALGA